MDPIKYFTFSMIMFFLGRPLVRLAFAYFYLLFWNWLFVTAKVCLGSSFAEHNRMKRNLYHFKSLFLSNRRNKKNRNLPIYKPQLTSTFPISHRISGAFLVTIVFLFYLLYLKMGLICFTYHPFYQFFFYSSKLMLIGATLTALALSYHLYNGVSHLGLAGRWNFKSLKYFVFWLTVYAALVVIPVPSDLFLGKVKVIIILGGSAALYFVGLASTPFEKEFCLNGLFLSSLSAATLWNIAEPTEVFLSILIYLSALFFLPVDFIFFLVMLGRVFLFADYGPALFIQTYFVYGLRKWRKNRPLLVAIYITIIFGCIWLGPVMLKGILFPLSGALAFFFFFVATSGKEHILASLFYLINQLFLCFVTENKEAAIYIIYIYAFLILIFTLLTIIMRINDNDRDNDRKVSKFTDDCLFLIFEGKIKFFFVFFALIFQLLPVSGSEQWVRALAETLFLQVAFLNLFIFLFRSLTKDREGGFPPAGHRLIDEMIEKRTTRDLIP